MGKVQNEASLQYFEHALRFIELSKRIEDLDELTKVFAQHIGEIGFSHFSCASFCDVQSPPDNAVMILEYPGEWLDRYMDQRFERFDKILSLSLNRATPFQWSDPIVTKNSTAQQRVIFNEAGEVGLVNGLTVPVHSNGFLPACVNVVNEGEETDPVAGHALHLMSVYLYEAAVRIRKKTLNANTTKTAKLTNRERECLQWAAEGKSDTVIAEILGISQRTAKFHIDNVKMKYGVPTRVQAIVRAYAESQIIPQ